PGAGSGLCASRAARGTRKSERSSTKCSRWGSLLHRILPEPWNCVRRSRAEVRATQDFPPQEKKVKKTAAVTASIPEQPRVSCQDLPREGVAVGLDGQACFWGWRLATGK
ncbi:hypothetical protein H1C71_015669, partial [Ictidomys tridecemlineatus]